MLGYVRTLNTQGGGSGRCHTHINCLNPLIHQASVCARLPSDSSSSSSASFSRTSAGRVIATAGVGSNIIVSNPVEVLSAMVVQHKMYPDRGSDKKNKLYKNNNPSSAGSEQKGCWCVSCFAATSHRCVRNLSKRHGTASCEVSGHTWLRAGTVPCQRLRVRCLSLGSCCVLTVCGRFSSTEEGTHSTPRSLPTAQSPLHHSNSSPGRARSRFKLMLVLHIQLACLLQVSEHSRTCSVPEAKPSFTLRLITRSVTTQGKVPQFIAAHAVMFSSQNRPRLKHRTFSLIHRVGKKMNKKKLLLLHGAMTK